MSDPREDASQPATSPGLLLEDVARAAAELAEERDLEGLLARFLERVREWGSPSAVLAAIRTPSADSGWRLLPALSFGSGPLDAERSLPKLVESSPGCLERPTLLHPEEDVPGVRPRDNCIVPWAHEGDSGILVLRGLPRPSPPNLGEAVAVLAAPVWPRLLGGPAVRIESLLAELRRVAERLGEDTARQLERLRAAVPPAPTDAPAEGAAEAARVAELEQQLESARQEARRAEGEQGTLRERILALETALKEAEAERDRARDEAEKLETRAGLLHSEHASTLKDLEDRFRETEASARTAEEVRGALQRELEEARAEAEHSTLEWDELKGRVAGLQEALQEAEGERDRVRDEAERLSARIESMQSEHASSLEQLEERRRTAETALRKALEDLTEAQRELKSAREAKRLSVAGKDAQLERVSALETELKEAQAERDRAGADLSRAEEQRSADEKALANAREDLAAAKKDLAAGREVLTKTEKELATAERDRNNLREELEAARKDLAAAREDLAAAQRKLKEAKAARGRAEVAGPEAGGKALEALRGIRGVLGRTPFVPPGLRASMEDSQALVASAEEGQESWLRVTLLDRDVASLEPLAEELEKAGIDVKIANYPEELALLMKTPDAQKLDAIVCDILAFRPDQTVAGLFRGWEKDRPGLSFFLTFSSDDPAEAERANRVPLSLTAGRLRRPIPAAELLEKLQVLAQRRSASEP